MFGRFWAGRAHMRDEEETEEKIWVSVGE